MFENNAKRNLSFILCLQPPNFYSNQISVTMRARVQKNFYYCLALAQSALVRRCASPSSKNLIYFGSARMIVLAFALMHAREYMRNPSFSTLQSVITSTLQLSFNEIGANLFPILTKMFSLRRHAPSAS
jgi:hypothetical protein